MNRQYFHNRFTQGIAIQMHEIFYPLLQGQDSVAIHADIEMGGTDQLFNCMIGRHLQEVQSLPAQVVFSIPLLFVIVVPSAVAPGFSVENHFDRTFVDCIRVDGGPRQF